jgi:hypothetical protein
LDVFCASKKNEKKKEVLSISTGTLIHAMDFLLVTEGLPFRVEASELQTPFIPLVIVRGN